MAMYAHGVRDATTPPTERFDTSKHHIVALPICNIGTCPLERKHLYEPKPKKRPSTIQGKGCLLSNTKDHNGQIFKKLRSRNVTLLQHHRPHWMRPTTTQRALQTIILHLFSGRRRQGDLQDQLEQAYGGMALNVFFVSIDIMHSSGGDVSKRQNVQFWCDQIRSGRVAGAVGGPPCEMDHLICNILPCNNLTRPPIFFRGSFFRGITRSK